MTLNDFQDLAAMTLVLTRTLSVLRSDDRPKPPEDEPNTYGLPTGPGMEAALKAWFARQREAVLKSVPDSDLAPVPDEIKPVDDWTDPMAWAMVPHLSPVWDASGKDAAARLGFDPKDFNVTSPRLKDAIHAAALKFCKSTNATTSQSLTTALDQLRAELHTGLVEHGESIPVLRKRIGRIFDHAEEWRAQKIAATETSRAYHAAQAMAGHDSGVVAGYELLLSGDACDLCRKIATEAKRVRIGQAFAVIGSNPDYREIKYPPLHPSCQCTMIEVISPEHGGPENPGWAETLQQPQKSLNAKRPYQAPEGKAVPKPEPDRPKPVVVKPKAKPVGHVEPVDPPAPAPVLIHPVGHVEPVDPRPVRSPRQRALPKFGLSKAKVTFESGQKVEIGERLRSILGLGYGQTPSPARIASMAGAPDNSEVHVAIGGRQEVEIRWTIPGTGTHATRYLRYDDNLGGAAVHNEVFVVDGAHRGGLGASVFGRQVETLSKLKVKQIDILAYRSGTHWVGYMVWPKFGYDGTIPDHVRSNLPDDLSGARSVQDLHHTERGKAWWKEHGDSFNAKFDLTPGSPSQTVWEIYRREKLPR